MVVSKSSKRLGLKQYKISGVAFNLFIVTFLNMKLILDIRSCATCVTKKILRPKLCFHLKKKTILIRSRLSYAEIGKNNPNNYE